MKKQKIGRNSPCPCMSGKKYKKCHGRPSPVQSFSVGGPADGPPPEVIAKAMRHFEKTRREEQERIRTYGQVRPEIAADFKDHQFVAVGNKLMYLPKDQCKYFPDFLLSYVPHVFGKEWFNQEIAKPPEERHPVMQWRIQGIKYVSAQPKLPDGTRRYLPNGSMKAYMTFAYDMYVVEHNAMLDARLLERLKHKDQFQGARHELFAEATCLRAGLTIEHENETDPASRHAEFTATHKATGQKVSVEAKSKHRPGVLGRPGEREPNDQLNLRFGTLLNDAVAKNAPHPLAVFMDLNMPFEAAERLLSVAPERSLIHRTLNQMRKKHGGKDPINLVVFTSHSPYYMKDDELAREARSMALLSQIPVKDARHDALSELVQAVNLYGNIPQQLPANPPTGPSAEIAVAGNSE